MILLDITGAAVTVEGDGDLDHLVTVRALQTREVQCLADRCLRLPPERSPSYGPRVEIEPSASARSGGNVLREYDIDDPGDYLLVSGRRDAGFARVLLINLHFSSPEFLDITVLPGSSSPVPWVVDDEFRTYREGETLRFSIHVTHEGVALCDGEVARIESDQVGVTFERSTAWKRILEDDDPNSV